MQKLLEKYDKPVPRYTSYPTVPYWETENFSPSAWLKSIQTQAAEDRSLSLYVHLPFCEKLCTYCGCNKHITRNHSLEMPYVKTVLKEWALYLEVLPQKPLLRELHLGGGTPTFFSPENLRFFLEKLFETVEIDPLAEFSFEAHPFSTTKAHLETLYDLGFRRLSIGVQDVDEEILKLINRQQTLQQVVDVTEWAREIGYESINFDLIFGLPRQRLDHISRTMDLVGGLRPERIAFYSYAHVPWLKNGQRAYSENDLPSTVEKRRLYETGKTILEHFGYSDVGMDHFALPTDALFQAAKYGTMHRNFMGYTAVYTPLTIGLGVSAIGDTASAFSQNLKTLSAYQTTIEDGHFPIERGHLLSQNDQQTRQHILDIMCRYETSWENLADPDLILARLAEPIGDGLVTADKKGIKVTERGMPFLRNIALAFDERYWEKVPSGMVFSRAV